MVYYCDYPKQEIGEGNPYYCCSFCRISDPQINGKLTGHSEDCEYRKKKQLEIEKQYVWIFLEDDHDGGERVDKVFNSEAKVRNYLYESYKECDYYKTHPEELETRIKDYLDRNKYEVE